MRYGDLSGEEVDGGDDHCRDSGVIALWHEHRGTKRYGMMRLVGVRSEPPESLVRACACACLRSSADAVARRSVRSPLLCSGCQTRRIASVRNVWNEASELINRHTSDETNPTARAV